MNIDLTFLENQRLEWLQIVPLFSLPPNQASLLPLIQDLLESILPENLSLPPSREEFSSWSYKLIKMLPLFESAFITETPGSFPITYLCPSDYTSGVRRYVVETLTRWLIPGKQATISGSISLHFHFVHSPVHKFLIAQEIIGVEDQSEWEIIRNTLPNLIREMKMNIQAVYHARYVASLKSVSLEQKHKIIQENLASLFDLPAPEANRSLYDQMQSFLLKLTAEEKIGQVKKNIAYLRSCRPKEFDRDVFYEMTHFTTLFRDQFSSKRQTRHISRVIALHYLFKKVLQNKIEKTPNGRHVSIKIFKSFYVNSKQILAVLLGINLIRDGERIEKKQLLDAIRTIIPDASFFPDSFIADRRDDKIRFFYFEIHKPQSFTKQEVSALRLRLPEELKRQIENAVHPIFMPRNEEELLRNLILLCKQLKYVRDLPQISIHYEKQTNSQLSFTILLARVIPKKHIPLKSCFSLVESPLHFSIDEVRFMGALKKKYLKEGAIIRVTLDKSLFFRQDYSVDLLRARQKVVTELTRILGEVRDFNGGMILKQDESLDLLRKEMGVMTEEQDFLLENYFYSIRPGIMQTVHEPAVLKTHFSLFLELMKEGVSEKGYLIKSGSHGKFFLYFIGAAAPAFKEYISNGIEKLKIPSYDLTQTSLQAHEISTVGYILRSDHSEDADLLKTAFQEALQTWKEHFSCPVPVKPK